MSVRGRCAVPAGRLEHLLDPPRVVDIHLEAERLKEIALRVLDFGKSVPSFVLNEEERVLADRDFVRAIAEALGTEVLEVGFVY